mgnify:CR=1 FL=1
MRKKKQVQAEVTACGQCGSTALHHVAYGLPSLEMVEELGSRPGVRLGGCCVSRDDWSTECLTCGQKRYFGDDSSQWTAATRLSTAALMTRYAELVRDSVGTTTAPAVSYAGLWLLLAHLAPLASGTRRQALAEAIGISCEQAAALAQELLRAPHKTIATALGAWSQVDVDITLAVPIEAMPDQAGLDRWAAENTRDLIKHFPLKLTPEMLLVFATAVVLQPQWTDKLRTNRNGMLVLDDGLQTLVDTQAAGRVAVAKPFSEDGVDVVSVIAAPDVSPREVWRAVDEVVDKLNQGGLWHAEYPGFDLVDGHAWTVRDMTQQFVSWEAPAQGEVIWRSYLPQWNADCVSQLTNAPGVREIVTSLQQAVPDLTGGPFECTQAATAAYDDSGFTAAAVTGLGIAATGVPQFVERTVRHVDVTFDRPHAVVAIARGGAWEGVPIFHSWVTPETQ